MPVDPVLASADEVFRLVRVRAGPQRLRADGQGYADRLTGLARDFGVDVA